MPLSTAPFSSCIRKIRSSTSPFLIPSFARSTNSMTCVIKAPLHLAIELHARLPALAPPIRSPSPPRHRFSTIPLKLLLVEGFLHGGQELAPVIAHVLAEH